MKTEIERVTTVTQRLTFTTQEIERMRINCLIAPNTTETDYSVEWDDCGEGGVMGATITYEKTERVVE